MEQKAKAKEKAWELYRKYRNLEGKFGGKVLYNYSAKQCALIAVENEYNSLREMLLNLTLCRIIESESVYVVRRQELIDEEKQVKQEIEKL